MTILRSLYNAKWSQRIRNINVKQISMHSFILEVHMKNKRLNACGYTINKRSNTPNYYKTS